LGDFVDTMRTELAALTRERVNDAIRRHLSTDRLSVVMIAKDGAGLRQELLSDGFTAIAYESPKSADVLAEDHLIGGLELRLQPDDVCITPVEDVFA
jgi:zinc protease